MRRILLVIIALIGWISLGGEDRAHAMCLFLKQKVVNTKKIWNFNLNRIAMQF